MVGGGAVCSVTPAGIRLDVANLLSLLDYTTLAFLLIACLLVLLGNNSFRAFGWAIRAMFQEKKPSAARALESYLAYRQVAIGSLLAGGAGSLLSLIKMMHSLGGGNPGGIRDCPKCSMPVSRICHLFESAITSGRVSVAKDVGRDRTGG